MVLSVCVRSGREVLDAVVVAILGDGARASAVTAPFSFVQCVGYQVGDFDRHFGREQRLPGRRDVVWSVHPSDFLGFVALGSA